MLLAIWATVPSFHTSSVDRLNSSEHLNTIVTSRPSSFSKMPDQQDLNHPLDQYAFQYHIYNTREDTVLSSHLQPAPNTNAIQKC